MTIEVRAVPSTPLAMVVEDDQQARELRGSGLESAGLAVIPVPDKQSALACLRDGPAVDLVVTDIDLGDGDARGGVDLARHISRYDAELPVVAYSGRYVEEDLDPLDLRRFSLTQTRGNISRRQIAAFDRECYELASRHKSRRLKRAEEVKKRSREERRSEPTRTLSLDGSFNAIDEVLAANNFELRLITSDGFAALATTVAAWVRVQNNSVDIQICGQPYLHWSDETEDLAIEGLVSVMIGYYADLSQYASELSPSLMRLRGYLAQVIDSDVELEG